MGSRPGFGRWIALRAASQTLNAVGFRASKSNHITRRSFQSFQDSRSSRISISTTVLFESRLEAKGALGIHPVCQKKWNHFRVEKSRFETKGRGVFLPPVRTLGAPLPPLYPPIYDPFGLVFCGPHRIYDPPIYDSSGVWDPEGGGVIYMWGGGGIIRKRASPNPLH